ncbi:unnamed protein product [Lepeophtheirus salmonis]|uniref:(salmon louse) hypothetical protein n=1 Tax=Lepeophtheirus salmonis TaxID=72036 RepID=A0A7R8GYZ4_LEPSM|nr:unnamed protein product [Lepeophtheirus salmonis]CAF2755309.1 unnamed protein product [Lepeophtheirus salmonis]
MCTDANYAADNCQLDCFSVCFFMSFTLENSCLHTGIRTSKHAFKSSGKTALNYSNLPQSNCLLSLNIDILNQGGLNNEIKISPTILRIARLIHTRKTDKDACFVRKLNLDTKKCAERIKIERNLYQVMQEKINLLEDELKEVKKKKDGIKDKTEKLTPNTEEFISKRVNLYNDLFPKSEENHGYCSNLNIFRF